MTTATAVRPLPTAPLANSHVDVLIVGAGISGIGAAHYLKTTLPHKTFTILEAREAVGGTWDLFRYPGIRSDSDLHTFAYAFKPWTSDNAIADGQEILDYLEETVVEDDLGAHIRFGHKVLSADFSGATGRWTVAVERPRPANAFSSPADCCSAQPATTTTPAAIRRSSKAANRSPAPSCIRRPGPRTSITRASVSS